MNYSPLCSETICALATAPGGAIAIVRVSGPESINITQKSYKALSGKPIDQAKTHTAHYGEFRSANGQLIDEVIVTIYRSPHSYTGEESVEISCHGSRFIISKILEELISHGCRMARPGEFTQRAFLNGKLDLSQAEAVADLIASTNSATHQMAMSQLRGHFSSELSHLREQLLHLTSLLELELDFSDHDVEFADRQELKDLTQTIETHIIRLVHSFKTGKALREGIAVAIVGKTNVGKSTLLNRLLHDDKAIVSDIHGTTRDVIEDTTQIHSITFRFIDTAGIRHTRDKIEKMGIERTYRKLDEAAITIWLTDEMPSQEEANEIAGHCHGKQLICAINKIDKIGNCHYDPTVYFKETDEMAVQTVEISAKHNINISQLEDAIYQAADIPEISENDVIVTNMRHFNALCHALEDIQRVKEGLAMGLSGDLLSEDLRACIHHLAEIVGGEISADETLGEIFAHFCVGK